MIISNFIPQYLDILELFTALRNILHIFILHTPLVDLPLVEHDLPLLPPHDVVAGVALPAQPESAPLDAACEGPAEYLGGLLDVALQKLGVILLHFLSKSTKLDGRQQTGDLNTFLPLI